VERTTPINVFAAASLTDAFTALGDAFEADHPTVDVTFNFAGSQQLAQQLAQGAPADIFASADQAQMAAVVDTGRIAVDAPRTFVRNGLVVVMPADNPGTVRTLTDLGRPGLRLVLADAAVPVGAYTRDFLARTESSSDLPADFPAQVLANTVSFEVNVRAVLSKVRLGEADAGIVYRSDVANESIASEVISLYIPDALNVAAAYPIAGLIDAVHPEPAAEFVIFVLSPAGQGILAEYGFLPGSGP
jgi:molybdate transport system substrate-binding protein